MQLTDLGTELFQAASALGAETVPMDTETKSATSSDVIDTTLDIFLRVEIKWEPLIAGQLVRRR